jgi:nucleoside phosphorylase
MTEIERMGYQNMTIPITVGSFDGVTCGTSDKFVLKEFDYENLHAYDMEAYSQARLCATMGIPFIAVKCVTDIVGQNTHEDYRFNRDMAMKKLGEFITPEFILSHMNI